MDSGFKVIFYIALCLAIFFSSGIADSSKNAGIVAVEELFDFGFVPIGFQLVHVYKIYNDGEADLRLNKLVPNCDCTRVIPKDTLIAPGDTTEIKIHFKTDDYYGPTKRHVAVHSNDPENPTILLEYSSNIGFYPKYFRISPKSLFFLQGHKSKELNLLNAFKDKVEFTIELEDDSVFTIDYMDGIIPPGREFKIVVTPNPELKKGTYESNFTIIYEQEKKVRITVPIKIARFK